MAGGHRHAVRADQVGPPRRRAPDGRAGMTRWPRGEAEIEELLRGGHLQQVTGAQTDGQPFLDTARRVLTTATGVVATDPESAYVLAYDAARHAATALLAHQGLRATSKGGH